MPAMLTPRMGQRPGPGQTWAADNGRYASPHEYSDAGYLAWLARMPVETCLFATAPDVVGDAAATLALSIPMLGPIRELGYRAALVAQPWLTAGEIPWDEIDVLFVGGPNSWQQSQELQDLVREAKRRGKWVHMGRVNGLGRLRYAQAIGCDSADGTYLRYGPDRNLPNLRRWLAEIEREPSVWSAE